MKEWRILVENQYLPLKIIPSINTLPSIYLSCSWQKKLYLLIFRNQNELIPYLVVCEQAFLPKQFRFRKLKHSEWEFLETEMYQKFTRFIIRNNNILTNSAFTIHLS